MILLIDYMAVISSVLFLAYGSWSDFKTREVTDVVWIAFAPIAISLTSSRVFLKEELLMVSIFSILIIAIISFIGFYTGMIGGADVKALICLGIAMPTYPSFITKFTYPFFPLSVLINSFLAASLVLLYTISRNIIWVFSKKEDLFFGLEKESYSKKILAFISGYKISLEDLRRKKHFYPLEEVESKGDGASKRLRIITRIENDEKDLVGAFLKKYPNKKLSRNVWITPLLPILVFITFGYLLTLVIGDTILKIITVLI